MDLLELDVYNKGLKAMEERAMRGAEFDRLFGKKQEARGFSLAQVREAVLQSLLARRNAPSH